MNNEPNENGYWGEYGGRFVPETLVAPLDELTTAYFVFRDDADFQTEFADLLKNYSGRPTPLYFARRLTEKLGGAKIYLKREDLNHTGAHKINNTIGQGLLTLRMGKRRVIAETGAGQHGVATATAAALFGLRCDVYVGACVGGGSNAAGIFAPFAGDKPVRLIGVEAGGRGGALGQHAASLSQGRPGVLHGSLSYVLQDDDGQTADVHSVSAGLDYPGVGPEHAWWKDAGRVEYVSITDAEALDAFQLLAKLEGILPALETAHAIAHVQKIAGRMNREQSIVVNLSGRGDKDCQEVARLLASK